jgi:hypothetical protein
MKLLIALLATTFSITSFAMEKPEGVVYCHGKTTIEYRLVNPEPSGTAADVDLTVNGKTNRYMTSYSWFGSNQPTPKNFKFAILGKNQFDPLLVFDTYLQDAKKQKYKKCN